MGKPKKTRRGIAIIWIAILVVPFIGLLGLVCDSGHAFLAAHQLHNAADASALAGAQMLKEGGSVARAAAVAVAAANKAAKDPVQLHPNDTNDPAGDIVLGRYSRAMQTFTPTLESPNAIKVVARRSQGSLNGPLALIFGPIFGVETIDVSRHAIAMGGCHQCVGIVLLGDGEALHISGDGIMAVEGPIQVNSSYSTALSYSGNGVVAGVEFNVVGDIYQSGNGEMIGELNPGSPPTPDPFASLPEPNPAGHPLRSISKLSLGEGTYFLEPGRYVGGIKLGNGTYFFSPGIYYIQGGGFAVAGDGTVNMDRVMIYNTRNQSIFGPSPDIDLDQIKISGNALVTWTPIEGGDYNGMSIFQDRTVSTAIQKKLEISGNGNADILGVIYAPLAEVQLSGNGPTDLIGGGFVALRMQISGNGTFSVGPSGPSALGSQVFLIE